MRDILYIYFDKEDGCFLYHGIGFTDFYKHLDNPLNILLIKHNFYSEEFSKELQLDFVSSDNIEKLLKDDIYSYGDFCWVDFKNEESFSKITPKELSEILYLGHMHKPLKSPFFKKINNRFACCAHDDDYFSKVYCKDSKEFLRAILRTVFSQRSNISGLQEDNLNTVLDLLSKGVVFDSSGTADKKSVKFYIMGIFKNMDEMVNEFKRNKEKIDSGYISIIDDKFTIESGQI